MGGSPHLRWGLLRGAAQRQTQSLVLLAMKALRRNPERLRNKSISHCPCFFGTCLGYCQDSDIFLPCCCWLLRVNRSYTSHVCASQPLETIAGFCFDFLGVLFFKYLRNDSQTFVTGELPAKQLWVFFFSFLFLQEQLSWLKPVLINRIALLQSQLTCGEKQ